MTKSQWYTSINIVLAQFVNQPQVTLTSDSGVSDPHVSYPLSGTRSQLVQILLMMPETQEGKWKCTRSLKLRFITVNYHLYFPNLA